MADLTRGDKAPAGATLATPSQWASDSAIYPVTGVTLYLDPSEVGFRYTLHWKLPLQSEMVQTVMASRVNGALNQLLADGTTRQIPDGAAVLTGTVAKDATFWLTRDFDAAPATWYPSGGLLLPTALANDSAKPKVWYFPSRTAQNSTGIIPLVDRANWQDVLLGFSTTMVTGVQINTSSFSLPAQIMGIPKRIHDFTTSGAPHDFVYYTAPVKLPPATIQSGAFWLSRGPQTFAQGQLWIYDGWSFIGGLSAPQPPTSPSLYNLQFRLLGARTGHRLTLTAPDAITSTDLYPYSSSGQSTTVFPDPWHRPQTWSAMTLHKTFSLAYQGPGAATDLWTLADEDTGQEIKIAPMTVANTSTDLAGWELPADPINLQISASRLGHSLWLRQRDGSAYHVVQNGTVGDVSISDNGSVWLNPYYYMEAGSNRKEGIEYWIYDEDTGEESPYVQHSSSTPSLIGWTALPTPSALHATGGTNFHVRLRWALGAASVDGAFSVERKGTTATNWTEIMSVPAANANSDQLFDLVDGSGQISSAYYYRIRYAYGGRISACSPVTTYHGTADVDGDEDGIGDAWETAHGRNAADASDAGADWDGDGIPDLWEILHGLDPNRKGDGEEDWDGDGLPNWAEYLLATDPLNPFTRGGGVLDGDQDSDGDSMNDRTEVLSWKNPWTPTAAQLAVVEAEGSPFRDTLNRLDPTTSTTNSAFTAAPPPPVSGGPRHNATSTPSRPQAQSVKINRVLDLNTGTYQDVPDEALIEWRNGSDDLDTRNEIWRGELIHSATGSHTEWKKLDCNQLSTGIGTLESHVDNGLKMGRQYVYRVRPWNPLGYAIENPTESVSMQYRVPEPRVKYSYASGFATKPGWRQYQSVAGSPIEHYLTKTISCLGTDIYPERIVPHPTGQDGKESENITEEYSFVAKCKLYPETYPPGISSAWGYYFSLSGEYKFIREEKARWLPFYDHKRTMTRKGDVVPGAWSAGFYVQPEDYVPTRVEWDGTVTYAGDVITPGTFPWSDHVAFAADLMTAEAPASRTYHYYYSNAAHTEDRTRTTTLSNKYETSTFLSDVADHTTFSAFGYRSRDQGSHQTAQVQLDSAREHLDVMKGKYRYESVSMDSTMPLLTLRIRRTHREGQLPSTDYVKLLEVLSDDASSGLTIERTEDAKNDPEMASIITAPGAFTTSYTINKPNVRAYPFGVGYGQTFLFGAPDLGQSNNRNLAPIADFSPAPYVFGVDYVSSFPTPRVNPYFNPPVLRAAIVPFSSVSDDAVVDGNGRPMIRDFDTILDISDAGPASPKWDKVRAPASVPLDSVTLSPSAFGPNAAIFSNPKKGGVYSFSVASAGKTTAVDVALPLAGAEMIGDIASEVPIVLLKSHAQSKMIRKRALAYAKANPLTPAAVAILSPLTTEAMVRIYWRIGAVGIDYGMDPVNTSEGSPTPAFQAFNPYGFINSGFAANYPYVTVNGVVVEGTRVNYMFLTAYLAVSGFPDAAFALGGDLDQLFRSKTGDTPQAHAAANAGFALSRLYDLQSDGTYTLKAGSKVDDVLTPSALLTMRDNTPSGFKSNFYWPAQSAAIPGDSIFLEPTLLTKPEDWLDAEFPNLPKSLD